MQGALRAGRSELHLGCSSWGNLCVQEKRLMLGRRWTGEGKDLQQYEQGRVVRNKHGMYRQSVRLGVATRPCPHSLQPQIFLPPSPLPLSPTCLLSCPKCNTNQKTPKKSGMTIVRRAESTFQLPGALLGRPIPWFISPAG